MLARNYFAALDLACYTISFTTVAVAKEIVSPVVAAFAITVALYAKRD